MIWESWRSHFLQQNFSGGYNSRDAAFLLTDTEARDLQNVQGTPAGAIVKRRGLVTLASPAVTLTSLYAFEAAATSVLIGAGGTSLYKVAANGTVTAIKTGLTSNVRWEFAQGPQHTVGMATEGKLYGVNGTNTPQQWDGVTGSTADWTNLSGGVSVPNGKFVVTAQNQIFIAGVAANPSRVFWSAIGDPTNWDPASFTGAGFEDFDPDDGQAISSIGLVGPYLLVAKPRKLWILVDPATAQVRRLSNNVGVIAHRSLASAAEGTYFLAEDRGVYVTDGSKLSPISDKIQPTIDSVQPGLRTQAAGCYFDAHYYLSIPVGGVANDTVLDYDATLQSWWKHSFGSNQWAVWHLNGIAALYSAKATAAIVDQAFVPNTFTDNGSAFQWRWASAWHSPSFYRRRWFPTPFYRKRLRQVRLGGEGTVDFSMAKDFTVGESLVAPNVFGTAAAGDTFGGAGLFGEDGTFGGSPTVSKARFNSLGVANAFSLVFSSTSTTADSLIYYMMALVDRRDGVPA